MEVLHRIKVVIQSEVEVLHQIEADQGKVEVAVEVEVAALHRHHEHQEVEVIHRVDLVLEVIQALNKFQSKYQRIEVHSFIYSNSSFFLTQCTFKFKNVLAIVCISNRMRKNT